MSFFSRYHGLLYLRLTSLGAYCLGLTSSFTPSTPERRAVLRVLPNLDIVVVDAALNPGDRLLLDSHTERRGDAVWHLDQAKLLAVVEGGKDIADFRKILKVRSADPLPEMVDQFLKDTEDRSSRLQDKGPARLIECSAPALALNLRTVYRSGEGFGLRAYQCDAAAAFYQSGRAQGGSGGVIVLHCGSGKTIVGMAAMAAIGESTLVLTTSLTSIHQWRRELLDKTDLPQDAIAEYIGEVKNTGPVTLSTYQILTYRPSREQDFVHFELFHARPWGLIIYDEVQLLPAPVFRVTAELQAWRRLGLTATLIRENGREGDVFALIGPKRYDLPWRELGAQGFIATAQCMEIRLPQDPQRQMEYALAERRQPFRIAAENSRKEQVVLDLLEQESGHRVLIIGEYISQLEHLVKLTGLPMITGKTKQAERERLYRAFREGALLGLILSRVGNFALDQFTRRLIGFGVHAGDVDGIALCRMFNRIISGKNPPQYLSSDQDLLFEYHRWQANLRIFDIEPI
jgi:superfamily II DNA or RNA helicase